MSQNKILEEKWQKFLRLRPVFSLIPFLDFVIVSGSLAFGNVHENSDFDVIIGARKGKIFTVRAFCVFIFGLLGVRRRGLDHKTASNDKVCFNHFVTPRAYRLSPPYNDYWKNLYKNLVPVYGREKAVREFFEANNWMKQETIFNAMPAGRQEKYWRRAGFNPISSFLEFILQSFLLGWFFEKFVKFIQLRFIKRGIRNGVLGVKPRMRYDDKEFEFHPDTSRIEEMLKKGLRFK